MEDEVLRALSRIFDPLTRAEKGAWAKICSLPESSYVAALEEAARRYGLRQRVIDRAVAWIDPGGRQLLLLFRLPDPGDLDAVRGMYDTIAANTAPLAYAFVHQIPDGEGTWDIFHMSRLTYLAHCNRVSGPGADVVP